MRVVAGLLSDAGASCWFVVCPQEEYVLLVVVCRVSWEVVFVDFVDSGILLPLRGG